MTGKNLCWIFNVDAKKGKYFNLQQDINEQIYSKADS